jgi:glycosyltransferase involved in cell wall biosynthesis
MKYTTSLARRLFNTGRYAVYRALLRVPEYVFAQNKRQRQLLYDNHEIESTLVGNGHAVPEGEIDKESPPIVLYISNFTPAENPKLFLEVADQCRDLPCKLSVVGRSVDDDLHRTVLRQVAEQDNLRHHGECGIVESNEYFTKASVYLHTGNTERFPNTFIEPWIYRIPVITLKMDPDAVLRQHEIGIRCESLETTR